ncbi:hypothetical protein BECAL_00540 [Bellilinea caldifistulae]|uniref:Uncharacterized protein n=1 Tax=Bellilinea caldifistulae TaxID=360411 RepID=A0A0P6Y154_9CHLR|nr:hypothetical protein [Bellilinea caldifistulae]KPL75248.1 hypothetical protein AC812_09865 [Bellilinea caldifistulae]GAP09396.1 hypothetical protein BECAL_00540 [Bellilinea caldifistulae]
MPNEYFSIPTAAELEKKRGWQVHRQNKNRFAVVRFHYLLRGPFQLDEPVRKGEVIAAAKPLRGVRERRTFSAEYEVSIVKMNDLIREAVRQSEEIRQYAASLTVKLGIESLAGLAAFAKAEAANRLVKSIQQRLEISISETYREKKVITSEYVIDPQEFEPDTTLVFVRAYKAVEYRLYLQCLDYLMVEYTTSPLSPWLIRRKIPENTGDGQPVNVIRLQTPLCTIRYWKAIPESSLLMDEKTYVNEVADPDEVQIGELTDGRRYPYREMPPRPTLYDLAERVFPARIRK